MENTELPLAKGGKSGKTPRRDRPAKCLNCTNEWMGRNGNEDKPSRCPVCGSRSVKWRDECADYGLGSSENTVETPISTAGNGEMLPENDTGNLENLPEPESASKNQHFPPVENIGKDDPENQTLEEIQKNFTGIPALPLILFMGIIGVFGLIWFLVGQAKNRRRLPQKIPYPVEYQTEMRRRSHTQGRAY